jgi:hypothetical protein
MELDFWMLPRHKDPLISLTVRFITITARPWMEQTTCRLLCKEAGEGFPYQEGKAKQLC